MDPCLTNKVALVTGGSSGIGLGIAQALVDAGVHVAIASRSHDAQVTQSLRAAGGTVLEVYADVSREADVIRMVRETVEGLGGLDLFVNNAAQALHQPLTRIDADAFHKIVGPNPAAGVWGCREAAKSFIANGKPGAILVVGSTSMYTPGPTETVYRMTKAGLKSLVQSIAVELAPHGIRANLLVPGHYRTRLTAGLSTEIEERLTHQIPMRRFGETSDCGNAAVFLLSPTLARYITGAELVVDGGLSLRPLSFLTDGELASLNR
ncbi:MAG TPA: SDR family oxidoreductase [Lacipirellulaceae bacterium]|nr:SDR family oxidoreductase [Lacipirellulaceae bacterium]